MRNIITFFLLLLGVSCFSQELNCSVVVNAFQTGNENAPIYRTMQQQLTEFVNNTKWTSRTFGQQERINCSMVINITEQNGEIFQASIQAQSSRPVFDSSFSSPIYNVNDKDFVFRYTQFQNLIFNPNQFESNIVSVLAFHVYMILGLDADSFSKNGGDVYFKQAQTIVNYSQQENYKGWKLEDGLQSRFALIDNILSPTFANFRDVIYNYHRSGLDVMSNNAKLGKEEIALTLYQFQAINTSRPNSFLVRTFFDAKSDEIEQIFSDGPSINITSVKETLEKVAPTYSSKWRNIKF